jgi:hypothetical protein
MALKEFMDARGQRWRVWDTVPDRAESLGSFRAGWLTFDNGAERRRLAPIPDGWAGLSDDRLDVLSRLAQVSGARESRGTAPDADAADEDRRKAERRQADRRVRSGRRPPV